MLLNFGDRSLVSVGALATRFRLLPVFGGLAIAFMCKSLAAVAFGRLVAQLPVALLSG
ncbi:MAG: TMEM165/GDT1 family protein [Gemmatimonadaceae bacterium]